MKKYTSGSTQCLLHLTVDTCALSEFRRIVAQTCGNLLSFMRIQPVDHARRMQVWLSIPEPTIRTLMDAMMRALPAAEFGRISKA